jgi:hypothetical protein
MVTLGIPNDVSSEAFIATDKVIRLSYWNMSGNPDRSDLGEFGSASAAARSCGRI